MICVLALLSNQLTVLARETYEVGTDEVEKPKQLGVYNELQHQVTNQLVTILMRHRHRYSHNDFINMLIERSTFLDDKMSILWSLQKAIESVES